MPPEHENLNRQLEALQRYVSDLQQQRERAKAAAAQPPPAPPRPSRRWLVLGGLLVALALTGGVVVGAVAWPDDRPAGARTADTAGAPGTQDPGTTASGPVASPACKTAVDRANTMLASAVKLRRDLDEYTRIMNDPTTRGLSGSEVVEKAAPALRAGSGESARFDQALAAYRQVVDQCRLHTP